MTKKIKIKRISVPIDKLVTMAEMVLGQSDLSTKRRDRGSTNLRNRMKHLIQF